MTPWASVDGDRVTIHGVRNLGYRTETDFVPNLGGPHLRPPEAGLRRSDRRLLGGQADRPHHVELRLRGARLPRHLDRDAQGAGESYSTIAGFFKQYELVYIVADERDSDPGRARTTGSPRRTSTSTGCGRRGAKYPPGLPRLRQDDERALRAAQPLQHAHHQLHDWRPHPYPREPGNASAVVEKILLSGYVPDYAYELGRTRHDAPLSGARAHVEGERARPRRRQGRPAFSQRIREGPRFQFPPAAVTIRSGER